MNILFITRKYPPRVGGMENFSYNLIREFQDSAEEEQNIIETIILNKSQVHLVWWFPYAVFLATIKSRKADVIHLGDPVLSLIGWLVKLFSQKPVVVTVNGLDITFRFFLYQYYLKLFGGHFDKYICISQFTKEQAEERGMSPCVVIPVGVDLNKFKVYPVKSCKAGISLHPVKLPSALFNRAGAKLFNRVKSSKFKVKDSDFFKKYSLPQDKYILLTVGRLVKRKGVYWFIDKVMEKLPQEMIYLVIGEGEEKKRIEDLIKRKGLSRKVYLLGRISEEDLRQVYQLADLFVMPNISVVGDVEGFGLVALEAALNGLPVIAAGMEGIRDAVQNQKNGILVGSGNTRAFQKEILRFFQNREYSRQFGLQAQIFTRKNYDWPVIAQRYYQEFLRVIPQFQKG